MFKYALRVLQFVFCIIVMDSGISNQGITLEQAYTECYDRHGSHSNWNFTQNTGKIIKNCTGKLKKKILEQSGKSVSQQ